MSSGNILSIITALPENAPELLHECNPVTWFERILKEKHQYKLAKMEIEYRCQRDKNEMIIALEELNTRKKAYLSTLEQQIKLTEMQNSPINESLNAFFKDLEHFNQEERDSRAKIMEYIGKIEIEELKILIDFHKTLFDRRSLTYKEISNTLDKRHKEINNQLGNIQAQILEHHKAIGK